MPTKFVAPIALVLATTIFTAHANASSDAEKTYEGFIERVKAHDTEVDYKQFRIAYSNLPSHADTSDHKKAMFAALRAEKFAEAAKEADLILSSDFVDMDAHVGKMLASEHLKNADDAEFHKYVYRRLLDSILDFGNGKSPKSAFLVVDVHEEYVVLHSMGITLPLKQSLMSSGGHSYDDLEVEDPQTHEHKHIFFNVDIPTKQGL